MTFSELKVVLTKSPVEMQLVNRLGGTQVNSHSRRRVGARLPGGRWKKKFSYNSGNSRDVDKTYRYLHQQRQVRIVQRR
jgi:hypothetical protein